MTPVRLPGLRCAHRGRAHRTRSGSEPGRPPPSAVNGACIAPGVGIVPSGPEPTGAPFVFAPVDGVVRRPGGGTAAVDARKTTSNAVNATVSGVESAPDAFNTTVNVFNAASDGCNVVFDVFNAASDVFNAASDGFNAASDGFNAASDAFNAASDAFNAASDAFNVVFDGRNVASGPLIIESMSGKTIFCPWK